MTRVGFWLFACCIPATPLLADVVVVANRTDKAVEFNLGDQQHRVEVDDTLAIPWGPAQESLQLKYSSGDSDQSLQLHPNGVYFFARSEQGIVCGEVGLTKQPFKPNPAVDSSTLLKIPVKVLVDDEEPRIEALWKSKILARLDKVSDLLEKQTRIRLDVVETGTWHSINHVNDFSVLLLDFERKVNPRPARLAIGFSTQAAKGRERLGGTRAPLHSHILIREFGRLTESERVEVVLHEVGHFLGAPHSPEFNSVMRPKLGDGQARRRGFLIRFDPVNTLVVNLVGDQMRLANPKHPFDMSEDTRARLADIYGLITSAFPEDDAADRFKDSVEKRPIAYRPPRTPIARHARTVVGALTDAAAENIDKPRIRGQRLQGEQLTEYLVMVAARTVAEVPEEARVGAFLLGLAVGLDDSDIMRKTWFTGGIWKSIETDREFLFRGAVLGKPTMLGRDDLTRHFFVAAAICAISGKNAAELASVRKEQLDGVFSFSDYAADLAGIQFCEFLKASPDRLLEIAKAFRTAHYIPQGIEQLPDIKGSATAVALGIPTDEDFQRQRRLILQRIANLPQYAQEKTDSNKIEE